MRGNIFNAHTAIVGVVIFRHGGLRRKASFKVDLKVGKFDRVKAGARGVT